jgi:DNA (cytosine-5)-methyltransferase 1
MQTPSVISLFSGGGGLDLGLEAVGFKTLLASDIDYHSCRTLENGGEYSRANSLPFLAHAKILERDICGLGSGEILDLASIKPGELDLLAGGPPCQAFSVFGKRRGLEDQRGTLVYQYLRILNDLKPKAFIFENVYGLMTVDGGAIWDDICKQLSRPGKGLKYTLSTFRLNAANFGVPQFRDRVFIIGSSEGRTVGDIPSTHSSPTDPSQRSWRTVRDALNSLPPIGKSVLANHTGRKHSQRIIDRYKSLSPGERDPKTRINKLDLDRPSFTIIVGSDAGGGKGHVHPTLGREVTPRESARIQTFPDWWSFSGTVRHPIRQVGNAVPPLLAAAIGNAIRKDIFGYRPVQEQNYIGLLGQKHLTGSEIQALSA